MSPSRSGLPQEESESKPPTWASLKRASAALSRAARPGGGWAGSLRAAAAAPALSSPSESLLLK